MSGHSKWSKVKHQKATTDVVKARAFTKAMRGLYVALREGGGNANPDINFRLRLAIEKAHYANVPKENIDRALAKASGEDGKSIESVVYEGYGPGGVAFLIEAATDNRARTVSVIKNLFDRKGGSLAAPGAVSYLFTKKGIVIVPKNSVQYDMVLEVALNGGAEDVVEKDDAYEIFTAPTDLDTVKAQMQKRGIPVESSQLIMRPGAFVSVSDDILRSLESLIEQLEAQDDVQEVYTNLA